MRELSGGRAVKNRGFTLIELLLVMLISSLLILGMNAAYRQANVISGRVESERPVYHGARLITETLREELSGLYFPPKERGEPNTDEDKAVKPFELLTLPNGQTELAFHTLTACWKGSVDCSRIAKVRYRFTRDPATGQGLLERFERWFSGEKPLTEESCDAVVNGLSDFAVTAVNASEGTDEQDNTPPKAVKILLRWSAATGGAETEFSATIVIPARQPLVPE